MIGISHIPHCYSNFVAIATTVNNSFFTYIEFVLAMEIFSNEGIPCCYGSSVPMATRLKQ